MGFKGEISPRRAYLANFRAGGEILDEIIFIYFKAPKSYTGEDLIEISCHGGDYIVEKIIKELCKAGARPANPGEFSFRAFINNKMDLTEAEAVSDLIASESESARKNALLQLQGGLNREIKNIRDSLLGILAELEVEIEFPEDEPMEADYEGWSEKTTAAIDFLERMIENSEAGKSIREGFRVVIAGPPNSGKSTLLNALLGEDRAIVHHSAGTTRDIIRESLEVGGIRIWLTDTAGLRDDADEVEADGINRTRRAMESSDLIVYLIDLIEDKKHKIETYNQEQLLLVGNKIDLADKISLDCDICISALHGTGIDELKKMIADYALPGGIEGGVIANERHLKAMRQAVSGMIRARDIIISEGETELVSLEIRESLRLLGEITGEGVTDEVLDRIFNNFCIGK